jgi:hypothetical protein
MDLPILTYTILKQLASLNPWESLCKGTPPFSPFSFLCPEFDSHFQLHPMRTHGEGGLEKAAIFSIATHESYAPLFLSLRS